MFSRVKKRPLEDKRNQPSINQGEGPHRRKVSPLTPLSIIMSSGLLNKPWSYLSALSSVVFKTPHQWHLLWYSWRLINVDKWGVGCFSSQCSGKKCGKNFTFLLHFLFSVLQFLFHCYSLYCIPSHWIFFSS